MVVIKIKESLEMLRKRTIWLWLPWLALWVACLMLITLRLQPAWQEKERLLVTTADTVSTFNLDVSNYTLDLEAEYPSQEEVQDRQIAIALEAKAIIKTLEELSDDSSVKLESLELPAAFENEAEASSLQKASVKLRLIGSFSNLQMWIENLEDSWQASEVISWQLQRRQNSDELFLALELCFWGVQPDDSSLEAEVATDSNSTTEQRRNPFQSS